MKIDRKEVFRYMGQRSGVPDVNTLVLTESICDEFERSIIPHYTYKRVTITANADSVRVDNTVFNSKSLAKHLEGVQEGVVLCATLGVEADNIIRRQGILGTVNAAIAQAAGAAMIEGLLDEVCDKIARETGRFILPRFSPGYGDWSLAYQPLMLELSDGTKRCGITMTDSFMMLPTKSVTAIAGLSDRVCNSYHNCENCDKKECDFRR